MNISSTSIIDELPTTRPVKKNSSVLDCGVCGKVEGNKYKCPRCRIPYCSVKCCKEHQEKCSKTKDDIKCEKSNCDSQDYSNLVSTQQSKYLSAERIAHDPLESKIRRRSVLDQEDGVDFEEDGCRITKEMMDKIDDSSWLRNELSDGGLRQIIAEIDDADEKCMVSRNERNKIQKRCHFSDVHKQSPREIALENAKLANSRFKKFIDKLLVTAGVVIQEEKSEEDVMKSISSLIHGDAKDL